MQVILVNYGENFYFVYNSECFDLLSSNVGTQFYDINVNWTCIINCLEQFKYNIYTSTF